MRFNWIGFDVIKIQIHQIPFDYIFQGIWIDQTWWISWGLIQTSSWNQCCVSGPHLSEQSQHWTKHVWTPANCYSLSRKTKSAKWQGRVHGWPQHTKNRKTHFDVVVLKWRRTHEKLLEILVGKTHFGSSIYSFAYSI